MQQPQGTGYADIGKARTFVQAVSCNQLLADGWVLLGVYPLTMVGEEYSRSRRKQKQPQDTQRYVRRLVGHVVGRRRGCRLKEMGLELIKGTTLSTGDRHCRLDRRAPLPLLSPPR
jgi:hypothetical protein